MNLRITSIADRGVANKERVVIHADTGLQLGEYLLLRSFVNPQRQITTFIPDFLWFADKKIEAGDSVIVYSKEGTDSERVLTTGKKAHFIYWGKGPSMWEDKEYAPVLIHAAEWQALIGDKT